MSRCPKNPLRSLTEQERNVLLKISRAESQPASHVIRAKILLLVASGKNYTQAAISIGRRSGDAVSQLVARFNTEGLSAVAPRHAGGPTVIYGVNKQEQILAGATQPPDRQKDGTANWSLSILQKHLQQKDGLSNISTYTIWKVLHEAGWSWQKSRSWCATGRVMRKRKVGSVVVEDPDTQAKKP